MPNISTIQDLKSQTILRVAGEELDQLIRRSLAPIQSDRFTLSIYFGRNMAKRYSRLASHLFNVFPAPFLRAAFSFSHAWHLQSIGVISANEIPDSHKPFVVQAAREYLAGRRARVSKKPATQYDLAILHDPSDPMPPSNERALGLFVKAAKGLGLRAEIVTKDDYGRLAEFDALFLRATTRVNHFTYRFARRAQAGGLVVIDDPESILRCCNKVYLAELLGHHKVPIPRTLVVSPDNRDRILKDLGLPCVLKQPDSSFSQGVIKIETMEDLDRAIHGLFEKSDLIIAQEFLPTEFDWRVGVFDRQPLYACKYHMARRHWQIIKTDRSGRRRCGRAETLPVETAPHRLIRTALKAAGLIGNGLYGVDVKELGGKYYVIEINDNPSLEAGVEDAVLRNGLYARIMAGFRRRIEARKGWAVKP